MHRFAMTTLAALLAVVGPPPLSAQSASTVEEQSRVRLLDVTLRFEPRDGARPGDCEAIELDDLTVQLRGERLQRDSLVELNREDRPTIHALILDISRSMLGKIDSLRSAAAEYLGDLDPETDQALVATFGDSVVLLGPPHHDNSELIARLEQMRMGGATSLYDALYDVLRELEGYRERPVIVVLTDGVDSTSLHERYEVRRRLDRRDDVTLFAIGYQLPVTPRNGSAGGISARSFLGDVAWRTNGKFFEVPTRSRLSPAFADIRAMLNSEAVLTVIDSAPDEETEGKISVKAPSAPCSVHVFQPRGRSPGRGTPLDTELPAQVSEVEQPTPLSPDDRVRDYFEDARGSDIDPACQRDGDPWFLLGEDDRVLVCGIDITMEPGVTYDAYSAQRAAYSGWLEVGVRAMELELPPLADLPSRPEQLLDRLADYLVKHADAHPKTAPLKRPAEKYSRPYHDLPPLANGRMFFDVRTALTREIYSRPDYKEWIRPKLVATAERELARLEREYLRRAPDSDPGLVAETVRLSAAGKEILARIDEPQVRDVQNHVAAWLGDISAYDLLVAWELERINRNLTSGVLLEAGFEERWEAVRRVFYLPSYARVLTLLDPVRDAGLDRIGQWRVVLPRTAWMLPRVKGLKNHPEWSDLPLDLIPDRPFGILALAHALEIDDVSGVGAAAGAGVGEVSRVDGIRYELLGPAYRHDSRRGYRNFRVILDLQVGALGFEEPRRLQVDITVDPKTAEIRFDELTVVDPREMAGLP